MQPTRVVPPDAAGSAESARNKDRREPVGVALAARGLVRSLGGRRVLTGVDLAIRAGECVVLRGDNGAGKTTLLKCLAGRLRPSAGEIFWLGHTPRHAPELHRQLGFVSHEAGIYPELTIAENLLFAARMIGLERPALRVQEMLDQCGLKPRRDQLAGRLSKGWRQRVGLARALIHQPAILLLDEPFASLDAVTCQWLATWLARSKESGAAILYSSHDERSTLTIADRACHLVGGRLLDSAPLNSGLWARSA